MVCFLRLNKKGQLVTFGPPRLCLWRVLIWSSGPIEFLFSTMILTCGLHFLALHTLRCYEKIETKTIKYALSYELAKIVIGSVYPIILLFCPLERLSASDHSSSANPPFLKGISCTLYCRCYSTSHILQLWCVLSDCFRLSMHAQFV